MAGWQNRPHDRLRSPYLPGRELSPNEAYAVMVARAGDLPVPLSGEDYIELLPVTWRAVNDYGIQIDYRTYDCAELGPYRRRASAAAARNGRWEVHYDPYDLSRVWMRDLDRRRLDHGAVDPAADDLGAFRGLHLAVRPRDPRCPRAGRHRSGRGRPGPGQPAHPRRKRSFRPDRWKDRRRHRGHEIARAARLGPRNPAPATATSEAEPEDTPVEPFGVFDPLTDDSGLW